MTQTGEKILEALAEHGYFESIKALAVAIEEPYNAVAKACQRLEEQDIITKTGSCRDARMKKPFLK